MISVLNADGKQKRNASFLHCTTQLELIFSALYKGLMICEVDIGQQLDIRHQLISHRQLDSHGVVVFFNC